MPWQLVLLGPTSAGTPPRCGRVAEDCAGYIDLLTDMQRLRGRVYLEDGALQPGQLTPDGRHVLRADSESWHLLLCQGDRVRGCMRYREYSGMVAFEHLAVSDSPPARCRHRGPAVRAAIEREIRLSRSSGLACGEAGGWALDRQLRGSTAALHLVLATYGLAKALGDAIVFSTATMRNGSAMILRRIGGEPLQLDTGEVGAYYDPQYDCEMQLLRFDSRTPNPKYAHSVHHYRATLSSMTVPYPAQQAAVAA